MKKTKLERVHSLIRDYECDASTEEALEKFSEVVVAEHGMHNGPDEIVVMGYFETIEGYALDDDGEPTDEPTNDNSMEELGEALKELGVRLCSECRLLLDESTGKLRPR